MSCNIIISIFRVIKDIAFSYKAYKISLRNQEGWQSLVYCNGLENRRAFIGTVGSNPTPSATLRATL